MAETFGKDHKHVLRDIRELGCSDEFNRSNFGPISYTDSMNRKQDAIAMIRDGFTLRKSLGRWSLWNVWSADWWTAAGTMGGLRRLLKQPTLCGSWQHNRDFRRQKVLRLLETAHTAEYLSTEQRLQILLKFAMIGLWKPAVISRQ